MLALSVLLRQTWLTSATGVLEDRGVAGVWPAEMEPPWRGGGWQDWADILAVIGPPSGGDVDGLLGELARSGAAGVVTAGPASEALLSAALRCGLPVLEADCPRPDVLPRLAQTISDARAAEAERAGRSATAAAGGLRRLLDLACGDEDVPALQRWLVAAVGGQAHVIQPHRPMPPARGGLVLPPERIVDVAEGARDTDSEVTGDWTVRLYGVGQRLPRSVLVVARRGDWSPAAAEAATRAQQVLAMWTERRAEGEEGRAQVRTAVLHLLLAGHVDVARRAAGALQLSPAVMRAGTVQVCVASMRAGRRAELMAALQRRLGDEALVAPGPDPDQAVIVHPHPGSGRVEEVLQEAQARQPGLYVGASLAVLLGVLDEGYRQACAALAQAVDAPDRWATYSPHGDLAATLPDGPAHRWEQQLLARLEDWEPERRALCLKSARLMLAYGPARAADRAGVSTETIRRRTRAVAAAAGLDYRHPGDQAVLDLALRIRQLRPRTPSYSRGPVSLDDLLHTAEARAWARRRLDVVAEQAGTLTAWLECGMSTHQTAARLGINLKTLHRRLHRAEQLSHQLLITAPAQGGETPLGIHDLILAAHISAIPCPAALTPRHLNHR
jgi:hypothetical protein